MRLARERLELELHCAGELGNELVLSPNTLKTQAVSIYRKLDAATRGQAVARARELGLLEG